MRTIVPLTLLFACSMGVEARAAIYVCTGPGGHQTYTDRGCPNQSIYTIPPVAALVFEPLRDSEAKQLQALAKRSAQTRQARAKTAQKLHKQLAKTKHARTQSCEQARAKLKLLARQRRKGYPLSATPELDATEAALKVTKQQNCG